MENYYGIRRWRPCCRTYALYRRRGRLVRLRRNLTGVPPPRRATCHARRAGKCRPRTWLRSHRDGNRRSARGRPPALLPQHPVGRFRRGLSAGQLCPGPLKASPATAIPYMADFRIVFFGTSRASGKLTVTVVPTPGSLCISMLPPCSSIKRLVRGKPSPVPRRLRAWTVYGREEREPRPGRFFTGGYRILYQLPIFGNEAHGSRAGSAPLFCKSSSEIPSGVFTKAMNPSRGGRLISTPASCSFRQVA